MLNTVMRVLAVALVLTAVRALPAAAQPADPPTAAPAATDGFVPVTELPPAEQLPAAPLVLVSYAFIWCAVLVYVGLLWRRLGAVQKDLDALKQAPPR